VYKLIGVAVVALAIAAALLPLWLGGEDPEQAEMVEVEPKALDQPDGAEGKSTAGPSADEGSPTGPGEPTAGQQDSPEGDRPWWKKPRGEGEDADQGPSPPQGQRSPQPSAGDTPSEEDGPGRAAAPEPESPAPSPEPEEEAPAAGDGPAGDEEQPAPSDGPAEPAQEGEQAPDGDGQAEESQQPATAEPPFWAVMVGSFQNPDNAEGLRNRLRDEGFPAQVRTREMDGVEWRRVLVGAEESKDAAQELVPRLEQAGYDNTLVLKVE